MHHLEVKRQMGQGDIAAVAELLDVAAEADGHRPLGEHQWLDLVEGGRQGFAGLVAWEPGHDHPVGYAQVTRGDTSWALEFVVDPHHRHAAGVIAPDLVGSALDVVRDEGGGRIHLWVPKPTDEVDELVRSVGFRPGRDLYQMRLPLPIADRSDLGTRPFRIGEDEERWLEVNNAAFAQHPEQGGWDLDTLRQREKEPWFDPDGFLLHERDGRLAGFCWTKVHSDHHHDGASLGEIYVLAVHPDFQAHGLGRRLLLAGLDHLTDRGLATAMLYVEAAHRSAVRLYEQTGFMVDHVDRAYVIEVEARPPVR
ncbi:MAG TPA: mycothiol synthase [Acidimicrobiales bacterium]|nr:mycothiol synthase [Acidimicrobiales bacterium]